MRKHFKKALQIVLAIWVCGAVAGPKEDFFKAVDLDAAHILTRMLAEGFDPNQRDDQGQVPLFVALRSESRQAVAALLADPRTEIDAVNAHGETPVMMAALRGDLASTRQLLERGARVSREGWTPLHYAASGPEPRLLELLLDRGAPIDARSPNGTTPLMMAARYGAIDGADLLLRRGADRALRNERGLTAADFAAAAGRDELARRLALPR
ncbi:MAG: ankyrin repeat domain-containing protein [Rubrivivax sp.]